jgi:hypothetical protein
MIHYLQGGFIMKKLWLIFLLITSIVFSWSAHEVLTYLIVKDFLPNSDEKIAITSYSYQEDRVYNTDYLKLDDYCGQFINTFVPEDAIFYPPDPKPVNKEVFIWQVLTVYSVEPDLGMDEGLNLSPLQSIIGNSQGVRHMKYKLLILDFFEGSQSFYYFVDMSRKAFKNGDRYWGYRFLARALHYLEDLSMPFHNSPGTFLDTLKALSDKQMAQFLTNLHYSYDDYLAYLLYNADEKTVEAIISAPVEKSRSLRQLIQKVRLLGLNNINTVSNEMKRNFEEELKVRILNFDDFKFRKDELYTLKQTTVEIISRFSSIARGFLIDFLKEVGEI